MLAEVKWDKGKQRYFVIIYEISDCRKIKPAIEIKSREGRPLADRGGPGQFKGLRAAAEG